MNYQEMSKNGSWVTANRTKEISFDSGKSINNTATVQWPFTTTTTRTPMVTDDKHAGSNVISSTTTTTTNPTTQQTVQYGFTSGHQNNFGVPIEEDERILKRLNDELIRIHNGTTTPRMATTTNEYRTKVSPTLPLLRKSPESTTERLNVSGLVNDKCVSTSIPLCVGVLHYDLTTNNTQGLSAEEEVLFKYLLDSRCSSRAAQFMCSLFEPECRPTVMSETLPPCKRFCKCEY